MTPEPTFKSTPSPRVSVVLPVHNGEAYLDEAAYSIRNQTLRDLELIIVENASTDASYTIASRHAAEDARVRVLHLDRPSRSAALNAGVEEARAEWIAEMDADDVSAPQRLERQMAYLEAHPDVAALGTYGWAFGRTRRPVGVLKRGPVSRDEFARARAAGPIQLLTPSVVFSRAASLAIGGHCPDYDPAEDADFFTRLADRYLVLTLPEPLIYIRFHTSSVSMRQLGQQMKDLRRVRLNMSRRRAGKADLSRAEFAALERQLHWRRRAALQLESWSQTQYRYGGILLADGNPAGAVSVALSALLYPTNTFTRLKKHGVVSSLLSRILHRPSTNPLAEARSTVLPPRV